MSQKRALMSHICSP